MIRAQKQTIKKNSSYYLTLTVVDWVDIFTRKSYKEIVIDSMRYCIKSKGLNVYAFCLMTNHLHMIVNCDEPFQLSDVIRDLKRHTVKAIISEIKNGEESRREWLLRTFRENGDKSNRNKEFKFWQTGNHAIELYTEKFVWDKINYIHNNPVAYNYVKRPEDWVYSSASNYYDGSGVLKEVYCLPGRLLTV